MVAKSARGRQFHMWRIYSQLLQLSSNMAVERRIERRERRIERKGLRIEDQIELR